MNGVYILQVRDKQGQFLNSKHKFGECADMEDRWSNLRHTIQMIALGKEMLASAKPKVQKLRPATPPPTKSISTLSFAQQKSASS